MLKTSFRDPGKFAHMSGACAGAGSGVWWGVGWCRTWGLVDIQGYMYIWTGVFVKTF